MPSKHDCVYKTALVQSSKMIYLSLLLQKLWFCPTKAKLLLALLFFFCTIAFVILGGFMSCNVRFQSISMHYSYIQIVRFVYKTWFTFVKPKLKSKIFSNILA